MIYDMQYMTYKYDIYDKQYMACVMQYMTYNNRTYNKTIPT